MKGLVIICLACSLVPCAFASGAAGATGGSSEPSAIERLVRQEDARRNDPRLGVTQATTAITVPAAPRIEVVTRDGFDWLDAAFGALAAVAVVAGAAIAALLLVERKPRHA